MESPAKNDARELLLNEYVKKEAWLHVPSKY